MFIRVLSHANVRLTQCVLDVGNHPASPLTPAQNLFWTSMEMHAGVSGPLRSDKQPAILKLIDMPKDLRE